MTKTAILVDGGFCQKCAVKLEGKKTAEDRAEELYRYVFKHLDKKDGDDKQELHRVFYYDCPSVQNFVHHPLLRKNIEFGKLDTYQWMLDFFDALKEKAQSGIKAWPLVGGQAPI